MKLFLKLVVLGAILSPVAYLLFTNNTSTSVTAEDKKEVYKPTDRPNLQQMVEGRGEHEFLYTHDPKTMTIPKERLSAAFEYTKTRLERDGSIPNVNWEERGPNNVSGRTRSILIDAADPSGNTLFSGGVGGGIWKTEDAGTTWTAINDFYKNIAIGDITQEPNNPAVIYFGTGEGYGNFDQIRGLGIWKSTNGGDSFTQLPSTDNNSTFFTVNSMEVVHTGGTTSVLAGTGSGVQRSTDGGNTWSNVLGGSSCKDMTVSRDGDIYAGMDNTGIFKSIDDGANWTQVYANQVDGNGNSIEGRQELSAAPSDNNVVYVLLEANGSAIPTIRRTGDAGVSWPLVQNPRWNDQNCAVPAADWTRGQDWYDLTVAVDPNNPNRAFIGGVDLFGTTDGGANWTQLNSWAGACGRQFVHADQHALVFLPGSSDVLWNGNDGGLFRTTNATATIPTFEFKGDGYNITQFYAGDIHPDAGVDYFLAGAQDNGTQRFQGAGLVNTTSATGGDGGFCHIDQSNNGTTQITSFTRNNYRVSNNGGASFGTGPGNGTGLFINPTDYDDELGVLYGASGGGNYFRWNDPRSGATAFDIVSVNEIGTTATHVRTSPNVSDRVYFGTSGRVVRVDGASTGTSNTGVTIFPAQSAGTISCVEIEIGNEDHMIVTYSNFGVQSIWESTNATAATPTWTNVENNLPDMPVRWALFNPDNGDQVMIATELGVWSTDNLNGGATDWQPTNANLANTRVDMLKARTSDDLVIAATHGRGLFSTIAFDNRLFFTKTAVSEANANDEITYEIEVFNNKTTAVTNVVITDVLDAGLEYVAGSATCGSVTGNTLTINEASLAAGATLTCTFKAKLPIGNFTTTIFEDDIESGDGNWTVDNIQGAGTWSISSANPRSPSNSWFAPNTGAADNTEFLILDAMTLSTNRELAFYHSYNTEAGWDGGFVEISVDGGAWEDLGPNIVANEYNSVLGVNNNTNINGRAAFSGNSGGYILTRIDLSPFTGSSVQIRFVFGEDDNTGVDGWHIDDVAIIEPLVIPNMACVTTTEGDGLCDNTSTLVFECEIDCFDCTDGIMNFNETGIDCGGPDCPACPTCDDGILNQDETEIDCGGATCPACPTCEDNIMNGDETGIDCGGGTCIPCDCNDIDDVTYNNTTLTDGLLTRAKNSITTTDVDMLTSTGARLLAGDHIDVNAELTIPNGALLELNIDDCTEVPAIIEKEKQQKKKQ